MHKDHSTAVKDHCLVGTTPHTTDNICDADWLVGLAAGLTSSAPPSPSSNGTMSPKKPPESNAPCTQCRQEESVLSTVTPAQQPTTHTRPAPRTCLLPCIDVGPDITFICSKRDSKSSNSSQKVQEGTIRRKQPCPLLPPTPGESHIAAHWQTFKRLICSI